MRTIGNLAPFSQSVSVVDHMVHSLLRGTPGSQGKHLVLQGSEGSKMGGTLGVLPTRREADLLRVI